MQSRVNISKIKELLIEAKSKSTCKKHPLGILIKTTETKGQIPNFVFGWNGPNSKILHEECFRKNYKSGEGLHLCTGLHAEVRGIMHALDNKIDLNGATLYMSSWFPCDNCAKAIIESKIITMVIPEKVKLPKDFYNFSLAEKMLKDAGIEIIVDHSLKLE